MDNVIKNHGDNIASRSWTGLVIVVMSGLLLAGCDSSIVSAQSSTAAGTAEGFVEAYYLDNDMDKAIALTSGDARVYLKSLNRAIGSQDSVDSDDYPAVTVEKVSEKSVGNDGSTIVYRVNSSTPSVPIIRAELTLTVPADQWYVSGFKEVTDQ